MARLAREEVDATQVNEWRWEHDTVLEAIAVASAGQFSARTPGQGTVGRTLHA